VNLKHVGVKGQLLQAQKLLKIGIDSKVKPAFVDSALFQSARYITKGLANIRRRKLYAVFLKGIWKQTERGFFDRALSGVGVGGFVLVSLFSSWANAASNEEPNKATTKRGAASGDTAANEIAHATTFRRFIRLTPSQQVAWYCLSWCPERADRAAVLVLSQQRTSLRAMDVPLGARTRDGLLFNRFVGTREHCRCNFQAERLGGLDIDY